MIKHEPSALSQVHRARVALGAALYGATAIIWLFVLLKLAGVI